MGGTLRILGTRTRKRNAGRIGSGPTYDCSAEGTHDVALHMSQTVFFAGCYLTKSAPRRHLQSPKLKSVLATESTL